MIHFTADTHFQHKNIIKYCNRSFKNIEEHDKVLINNWNAVVRKEDTIYHLGDFCFGNHKEILKKLNGNIIFVKGSHDKWLNAPYIRNIKIEGISITLCHYAMRTWHKSHFNSWHLFGHSHGGLKFWGKSFDVGVDSWNYQPISFESIRERMHLLPNNFNLVRK